MVKSQQTPNPCSGMDVDPPATFPVNTRAPKRSPPVLGVNVTNTWQNMPAASGCGGAVGAGDRKVTSRGHACQHRAGARAEHGYVRGGGRDPDVHVAETLTR